MAKVLSKHGYSCFKWFGHPAQMKASSVLGRRDSLPSTKIHILLSRQTLKQWKGPGSVTQSAAQNHVSFL